MADLARHVQLLRRFRGLIAAGALAGLVLAALSVVTLAAGSLKWRTPQTFTSDSRLLVTQGGFAQGRVAFRSPPGAQGIGAAATGSGGSGQIADPTRLNGLASIYAALIESQPLHALIPGNPPPKDIAARHVLAENSSETLPIVELVTRAGGAERAQVLNRQTIGALRTYLRIHQESSGTPPDVRALVQVIEPPSPGLGSGHRLRAALLTFLLTVLAAVALAYILERRLPPPARSPRDRRRVAPAGGRDDVVGRSARFAR